MKIPMSRVGRRRLLSAMIALTFCLSAVFGLLAASSSDSTDTVYHEGPTGNDTIPVRALALTVHDPILIDGNAGFTNASGVVWGSGIESDPYIIEEWDISSATTNGIDMRNTNAHFIVRACHFHEGWPHGAVGVCLVNCTNGTLDSNNCSSNADGMYLENSSGNVLINNICYSNNLSGIYLRSSSYNTVVGNICTTGYRFALFGIFVEGSSGNTIFNNTCSNEEVGISLYSSSGNNLNDNSCPNDGDGMYLYDSSNNILSNNTCSSSDIDGICIWSSSNNTISNNNCSNDGDGIWLDSSSGNTITSNLISNTPYCGVQINSGSNNTIWNNTFYHNNGAGDVYNASHIQASDGEAGNWWNSSDGYGNYWSDWTGPDDDMNGIVDLPYNMSGSAGARDYYPLTTAPTEPIPEFGMMPLAVMVFLAAIVLTIAARRRKA